MALADYYLCDICESKTFYDARLDYSGLREGLNRDPDTGHPIPDRAGTMRVLCEQCAITHRLEIVER